MVTDSAALVVFALRSAIRLSEQARKSYIDATKRRELILPLPRFFADLDSNDEAQWFNGEGSGYLERSSRLERILEKFNRPEPLDEEEKADLHNYYVEFHTALLAEQGELPLGEVGGTRAVYDAQEMVAWVTVR